MKMKFFLLSFIALLTIVGCEQNASLSPRISRFIASEHILKIDGKETLSRGVKELLYEEQNLHNKDLWGEGAFSSNINPAYIPENNPKFPLPYYLVPEEDANFLFANSLDPRVADQLVMKISGKKHYKLFVHPESEAHYDFLHASYNYIGPEQTEFFASPTSSYRSLVVWNRNNGERKPFIAKVSLDKNVIGSIDRLVSENEVERSVANQKVFDRIGEKKLNSLNLKIFPESAGLTVAKAHPGAPEKLGGQIIREIPDEVVRGEKKWLSFSALMSPNKKPAPLIMDVIKRSGLSSYDFFKMYMIDSYLEMYEEISLKNGINFEPHSQNLVFETTNDLKPTGKWVLRDFGGVWPDIFTMAKNNGPVDVYMETASALKYKLRGGRANYISSYVFFYKRQIFDMMLAEVAKYDSTLTPVQVQTLKNTIDTKYTKMINAYLGLSLKTAPNMTDYKRIEEMVIAQTELDGKTSKKEIKDSENLKTFIENKKSRKEWVELSAKNGKSEFYLTDHGLYEISNKKITGLALFSRDELEEYNANDKMLTNFKMHTVETPDKTGCLGIVTAFFARIIK
ncbi:MAG: hypothetical protein H7281_13225 [Bacteriovorax sp.]|nr:hypothetical protein [Bacteriovorax sp.]